jgi:hypothetical protein
MHADVIFERFRVFEDMGKLGKCLECIEAFQHTIPDAGESPNSTKTFLLKLSAAYIRCFVKGEWQNAMELALLAYEMYLSGRTSYNVYTVCKLVLT